jgi:hypothetical protein
MLMSFSPYNNPVLSKRMNVFLTQEQSSFSKENVFLAQEQSSFNKENVFLTQEKFSCSKENIFLAQEQSSFSKENVFLAQKESGCSKERGVGGTAWCAFAGNGAINYYSLSCVGQGLYRPLHYIAILHEFSNPARINFQHPGQTLSVDDENYCFLQQTLSRFRHGERALLCHVMRK